MMRRLFLASWLPASLAWLSPKGAKAVEPESGPKRGEDRPIWARARDVNIPGINGLVEMRIALIPLEKWVTRPESMQDMIMMPLDPINSEYLLGLAVGPVEVHEQGGKSEELKPGTMMHLPAGWKMGP